jgi:hypothetical protein
VFIEKNDRWAALFFRELLADRDGSEAIRLQRTEGLKFFAGWFERNIGESRKNSIILQLPHTSSVQAS